MADTNNSMGPCQYCSGSEFESRYTYWPIAQAVRLRISTDCIIVFAFAEEVMRMLAKSGMPLREEISSTIASLLYLRKVHASHTSHRGHTGPLSARAVLWARARLSRLLVHVSCTMARTELSLALEEGLSRRASSGSRPPASTIER